MNLDTEPSVIIGTITALVAAVISLLVAFGLDLTPDQRDALIGLTAVLAPLIASIVIRSKVWAPASVQEEVNKAARTGLAQHVLHD